MFAVFLLRNTGATRDRLSECGKSIGNRSDWNGFEYFQGELDNWICRMKEMFLWVRIRFEYQCYFAISNLTSKIFIFFLFQFHIYDLFAHRFPAASNSTMVNVFHSLNWVFLNTICLIKILHLNFINISFHFIHYKAMIPMSADKWYLTAKLHHHCPLAVRAFFNDVSSFPSSKWICLDIQFSRYFRFCLIMPDRFNDKWNNFSLQNGLNFLI